MGHLLCELAVRLEVSGIGSGQAYDLPMTQEQLGDAVGITAVHVNRSLKSLARDGLINQVGRRISFPNWNRLKDAVGFNARYLYVRPPSQWGSQTPS
ncbi:Crp/Fnr family transcriptional regulator [Sphingomonas aurantiaca]|uniref:Crp/Fnr family transcriptional regulator n=1 Tax=Sphingomonas aurantiaca TaxID=185949 RepID=UPI003A5C212B